jgi:serine/threonine protein kinase
MDELGDDIEEIRLANENHKGQNFVPEAELEALMTASRVRISLKSSGIPVHEQEELIGAICQGAKKCFAILLLIHRGKAITNFFKHDSLQSTFPDKRLPYSSDALQTIFGEVQQSLTVLKFLERQWDFTVPTFSKSILPRKLDRRVILPYLREEYIARGSFGVVWKAELHSQHHKLPLQHNQVRDLSSIAIELLTRVQFIRKEVEQREGEKEDEYTHELQNLCLLVHLKHPNIVELFCAYVHHQRFNLVFEVAEGGTLEDYLEKPAALPEEAMLTALPELASAIDALHNFMSDVLDIRLTGCHHDLAARNILIRGQTLLLADFGLSSFRSSEEGSLTMFKEVRGSYVAPECQTFAGLDIQTEKITNASDIWSFGCLLAEIVTHMIKGEKGVEKFRKNRFHAVNAQLAWYRFHRGPHGENPEVHSWLSSLMTPTKPYVGQMVQLIKAMLCLSPDQRPKSKYVLRCLRCLAISAVAEAVRTSYLALHERFVSEELKFEMKRFESWLFAFGHLSKDTYDTREELPKKLDYDYPAVLESLTIAKTVLQELELEGLELLHGKHSLLGRQNTALINKLPEQYHVLAKTHLERDILSYEEDETMEITANLMEKTEQKDIGVLLALKRMTLLANKDLLTDRSDLLIPPDHLVLVKDDFEGRRVTLFQNKEQRNLVEWLFYDAYWAHEKFGKELRERVTSIAALLSSEQTPKIPGALRCQGFFHDSMRGAFGLSYAWPADVSQASEPVTLCQLLHARDTSRPPLEYRFQLAYKIARSILVFHEINWLHRNLNAKNIVFFASTEASNADKVRDPFLLGFARSRQSKPNAFTRGPPNAVERELLDYQHPLYLQNENRYTEIFDYYSVGMLMLEIGLWNTLAGITSAPRFRGIKPQQFREQVLRTRVPQLALPMGSRYMNAVRVCLSSDFDTEGSTEAFALQGAFRKQVLDEIEMIDSQGLKETGLSVTLY